MFNTDCMVSWGINTPTTNHRCSPYVRHLIRLAVISQNIARRKYPPPPHFPICLGVWSFTSSNVSLRSKCHSLVIVNKANLRDLIAATGLVISNWIQIINFSACVTMKFDGWPRKTIGHLFYATSSFVHHFVAIGEFQLELQSGNAQFGSKSTIFLAVWPWNLTDDLEKNIGHLS